jgi:hypothetical protein
MIPQPSAACKAPGRPVLDPDFEKPGPVEPQITQITQIRSSMFAEKSSISNTRKVNLF